MHCLSTSIPEQRVLQNPLRKGYIARIKSVLIDIWDSLPGQLKALGQGSCLTRAEIAAIEPRVKHYVVANTVLSGTRWITIGNQASLWPSSLEQVLLYKARMRKLGRERKGIGAPQVGKHITLGREGAE